MPRNPTHNPTNTPYTLSFRDTDDETHTAAAGASTASAGGGGSRSSAAAGGGGAGACAVCKHQRRKCPPDCPLAPHFPAYKQRDFLNVHKLFGVRNLTRALTSIDKRKTHDFMVSVIYEANARAADPVGGCLSLIHNLNNQLKYTMLELDIVNQQLSFYRSRHQQLVHGYEGGSTSDHGLSHIQDLIRNEKQHIIGDQGIPYTLAEKRQFASAGSVTLSDGAVVIDDLMKAKEEEEDDLKNAASKFSLRK